MSNINQYDYDHLRNLTIGTVDYVSPNEIKVMLDTSAPQNTALNTGTPSLFPRINGFVLIPNEVGALVGLISWIGVEHSQYPKRKGYKDFDLIDLPFPLRKMSITPMGTLKQEGKIEDKTYKLERGVYSFPSIGDTVILPTDIQLKSIVENKEKNSVVKIGIAPIAGNAEVKINPDKLFGRHVAILGNTGSGKSCSVAGVIRWSLEEASKSLPEGQKLNNRFIILDPNGEYTNAFDDLNSDIKKFKVELTEAEKATFKELKVPAWLWNSYEWSSFSNASGRTQRPILRRALRELRSGETDGISDFQTRARSHFSSCYASLRVDLSTSSNYKDSATAFGNKLLSIVSDAKLFESNCEDGELKPKFIDLADEISGIAASKYKSFQKGQELVEYYVSFSREDVEISLAAIQNLLDNFGGLKISIGPNEDTPIPFEVTAIPDHVERLSQEAGVIQFVDFLIMRMRSMLSDTRMNKIIADDKEVSLENWLDKTINGISIIDLSLVPSDITHLLVSVISRVVFESLQRYRRTHNQLLPTVIVMEEAHNFIKRYNESSEEISASQLCTESFEKIAREGRKFGLSLTLSSQRPSELSPTVLSQCNTFLLHRIVNDRDQELVRRLVPDNIGGLLQELPILPTRKAILLGWASPLPILVEMNELKPEHRPKSDDPDFWDVWTRASEREVNWKDLSDDWQSLNKEEEPKEEE
ncbi:MAG: ATP-binding protein [Chitinophagaceae bacterium]|nr:ATP-binding protein [Chitinophagaceae bacterium]